METNSQAQFNPTYIYGTAVVNRQRYAIVKDHQGFIFRVLKMASWENGLSLNEVVWHDGDEMTPFVLDILGRAIYP